MFKVFPGTFIQESPKKWNKIPLVKNFKAAASDNPEQLKQWIKLYGKQLMFWGLPTGTVNNIIVVDLDPGHDAKALDLPKTLTQKTPRGMHHIYLYPNDSNIYGNKVDVARGVDIRGEGGCMAWYDTSNNHPISPAPQWVLSASIQTQDTPVVHAEELLRIDESLARTEVDQLLIKLSKAAEGTRNHTLFYCTLQATQIAQASGLSLEWVHGRLKGAAEAIGLSTQEIEPTIKSGTSQGLSRPIRAPQELLDSKAPQIQLDHKVQLDPQAQQQAIQTDEWMPQPTTLEAMLDESKMKKPQIFEDWTSMDISVISGDGGSFKTSLLLMESICATMSHNFMGFENKISGNIMFLTGEDSREKLASIMGQISKAMEYDTNEMRHIGSQMFVKKDLDLQFVTKGIDGTFIVNRAVEDKIHAAIDKIKPIMLIVDPLSMFWGHENALNDSAMALMRFCGRIVEKYEINVTLSGHASQAASQTKEMGQFAIRGGTAIPSHARIVKNLRHLKEEEYHKLTANKLEGHKRASLYGVSKYSDGSPMLYKQFIVIRDRFKFTRHDFEVIDDNKKVVRDVLEFIREKRTTGKQMISAYFDTLTARRLDKILTRLIMEKQINLTKINGVPCYTPRDDAIQRDVYGYPVIER